MVHQLIPRIKTSEKWTGLPAEFVDRVRSVFAEQFEYESTMGEFIVEGMILPSEIIVRVGYLEKGRLRQINFEASIDRTAAESQNQTSAFDKLYVCVDVLGSLMEEYFDAGSADEMDVPLNWKEFDFEDETVYLQHSTVNTSLEAEADRLLGIDADGLVHETSPSDDALANADIDTDLALAVQQVIREGRHPLQNPNGGPDSDESIN